MQPYLLLCFFRRDSAGERIGARGEGRGEGGSSSSVSSASGGSGSCCYACLNCARRETGAAASVGSCSTLVPDLEERRLTNCLPVPWGRRVGNGRRRIGRPTMGLCLGRREAAQWRHVLGRQPYVASGGYTIVPTVAGRR